MIGALFYLLGSFYGFISSDFTKSMNVKLSMMVMMVMFIMTYSDLYKNGFKMTSKVGKSIGYNLGMIAVMSLAAFSYSTAITMTKKLL